jgi:hypothetical protein
MMTLMALLWLGVPVHAQTAPAQTAPADRDDITRSEVATFDQFLDNHPETAEQLRKDPSLINNKEFIESHQNLREFLEQHPEVREELKENPNAFMHDERRFERREDDRDRDRDDHRRDNDRAAVAKFDQFLDSHPETAEQLRKDPSLINNKEFIQGHQNLKDFLEDNPQVREDFKENPNAFMHQEERFDRSGDDRDRDVTRGQLASFDRFLDSHEEIAEQLRKNPSLANNEEFVDKHPALHEYLQQNPAVRADLSQNPNAFLHDEQRFERRENIADRRSVDPDMSSFNEFLGGHSNVAAQLSRDPSLAKNQEYLESHPELQEYLKTHPGVQQQLAQNPQVVMKAAQPMTNGTPTTNPAKPAQPEQKPKQ